MNKTTITIIRIGGLLCTIVGTIASGWAGAQENKIVLNELVEKHFQNQ